MRGIATETTTTTTVNGIVPSAPPASSDAMMSMEEMVAAINNMSQAIQNLTMLTNNLDVRMRELESKGSNSMGGVSTTSSTTMSMSSSMTASPSSPDVINFNVGGQKFTTAKSTLLRNRGTYFEDILIKNPTTIDFFIDRDPKYFGVILNFLREGKLKTSDLKSLDFDDLKDEFRFFKIPPPPTLKQKAVEITDELIMEKSSLFSGGTLLTPNHKFKITEWLPSKKFTLIYKASSDGFASDNFHHNCDDKGPTLTVIQAQEGHLFGGYTSQSWVGNGWKTDQNAFLYTLSNPHNIPPTRFPLKPIEAPHAIMCYNFYLVVFGVGHDLQLSSNSNEPPCNNWINFPGSYVDVTGKGKETFTGSTSFTTSEVEVFLVQ